MAFDDALAQRIRNQMTAVAGVSEKKMFGGLAFLPARAGCRRRLAGPISRAAGAALAL